MVGEVEATDNASHCFISAVMEYGTDDGFQGGGNHFGRYDRAFVAKGASVDTERKASAGETIIAQDIVSYGGPIARI